MYKILLASLCAAVLAGCATTPPAPYELDHTLTSKGQASRVRFIVIHYTVADLDRSIMLLTEKEVSAHYLLTDTPQPKFYALVDEKNAAWHAGLSSWKNYTNLNNSSIGIEIVNPGFIVAPDGKRVYQPFSQAQIDKLIPLLKDLVARHKVAPENILGHSDVAPQRKQDPGPLFPWKQLADAGLVAWPSAARVAEVTPVFQAQLPDVAWYQKKLAAWGYGLVQSGVLDEQTRTVLSAFQMKYRPANIDGMPDVETAALLEALTNPAGPLPQLPPPAVPAPVPVPVPVPDTVTEPVREPAPAPAVADPNTVPATPPAKVQH